MPCLPGSQPWCLHTLSALHTGHRTVPALEMAPWWGKGGEEDCLDCRPETLLGVALPCPAPIAKQGQCRAASAVPETPGGSNYGAPS